MVHQSTGCPKCGLQNNNSAETCSRCGIGLAWALKHWDEYVSGEQEKHPPVILVSDDDAGLLELISLHVQGAGYRVATEADPLATLELAEHLLPDLITTDILKPRMDGYEMIQRLRANPAMQDVPVLIVSAKERPKEMKALLKLGVAGYVTKPFRLETLMSSIGSILSGSRNLISYSDFQDFITKL